jgi:arginyl-tRNA synthetase
MSFWSNVKAHVASKLSDASGSAVTADELVLPPKPDLGDLAFGCFKIAKAMGKNPAEAAKEIASKFGKEDRLIASATAAGPFVNITLHTGEFIHRLVQDVEESGPAFGANTEGAGKTLMLEYAQPNTHKEMHVGHLRNLTLGSTLVNMLGHAGWKVIPTSYHGDVGAHVSKCLWWMVEQFRATGRWANPDEVKPSGKKKVAATKDTPSAAMGLTMKEVDALLESVPREHRTGRYLGELYAQSTREMETHEESKDATSAVLQALEAKDPAWTKLWLETRRWSLDEFAELFDELGVKIDRQYLESEVVDDGQKMVDELLKKGVAKESQGAIVVDLEEKKLGVFLIRKSDGTSLYATKDLALAYLKAHEYPSLNRNVILVDNRQELYFKQLFESLKLMGYKVETEFVGYEFVTLKSGAMSSREGNVVSYQDFRDDVLKKTRAETIKRHDDWNEGKVRYASWALAMAGVKFGMLRQDPEKIFVFDLEQALSFEGDTGPYVQYAAVRLGSILKKAGNPDVFGEEGADCHVLKEPAEKALALSMARFEDVFRRAAHDLHPGMIAQWCVETAQTANAFYRDVKVLDAPKEEKEARLRLVSAAKNVLTIGLEMLGIPVPEEM